MLKATLDAHDSESLDSRFRIADSVPPSMSRKGFCRNPRGIFPNKVPSEFCGDFLVDFFGPFSLEKTGGKIHPKIHGKIQIRLWEFRGQNPHCKNLALKVCNLFVDDSKGKHVGDESD